MERGCSVGAAVERAHGGIHGVGSPFSHQPQATAGAQDLGRRVPTHELAGVYVRRALIAESTSHMFHWCGGLGGTMMHWAGG